MRSMKKALAFVVVLAMVLTTVAPVIAATPADVVGTDYETAVGNLSALGIISGDKETGNYRPGDNITRAEFAKIACYLLGMQAAGQIGGATTKFKDVGAGHWASGFISIAAGKGIIRGYPGGLFKPDENVTYGEAITILVRAIGMGEFVEKQGGTWPANYIAAGSSAGITSDVAGLSADGKALRGIIAQLAWNTLEVEKWGPKEYTTAGITYGPMNKTIMEELYKDYVFKNDDDKYQIKWFEDVKVTGQYTSGDIDADTIKIDCSEDDDLADCVGSSAEDFEIEVAEGIETIFLYGHKVDILLGKDDKIMSLRIATPAKNFVKGYLGEFDADDDNKLVVKANKADNKDVGTKYKLAADNKFVAIVNSLPVAETEAQLKTALAAIGDSNAAVEIILDSGNIETLKITTADVFATPYLDAYKALAGDKLVDWKQFVVADITSKNVVESVGENREAIFDLDDLTDTDDYAIFKNLKRATKEDIKVGDAVVYFEKADFTLIYVSDMKVSGNITKNQAGKADKLTGKTRKLTVDGNVFTMPLDGSALYSKKDGIEEEDVEDTIDDMKDFYKKDVTVTLNPIGDAIFVSGKITASSASMQIGVITRAAATSGDNYSVKILNQEGTVKSYTLKAGDINDTTGTIKGIAYTGDLEDITDANQEDIDDCYGDLIAGTIVLFEVSSDNNIDAEDFYVLAVADGDIAGDMNYGDLNIESVTVTSIKDSTKKLVIGGDAFYAKEAKFLNAAIANIEKIDSWATLVKDDFTGAADTADTLIDGTDAKDSAPLIIVYNDDDSDILAMVVNVDENDYLDSDELYGAFIEEEYNDEDQLITLLVDGVVKTYTVAGSIYGNRDVDEGDIMKFALNGDGKYVDSAAGHGMVINVSWIADNDDEYFEIDKVDDTKIVFKEAYKRANGDVVKTVDLSDDVVVIDARDGAPKAGSLSDLKARQLVSVEDYDTGDTDYSLVVICK